MTYHFFFLAEFLPLQLSILSGLLAQGEGIQPVIDTYWNPFLYHSPKCLLHLQADCAAISLSQTRNTQISFWELWAKEKWIQLTGSISNTKLVISMELCECFNDIGNLSIRHNPAFTGTYINRTELWVSLFELVYSFLKVSSGSFIVYLHRKNVTTKQPQHNCKQWRCNASWIKIMEYYASNIMFNPQKQTPHAHWNETWM